MNIFVQNMSVEFIDKANIVSNWKEFIFGRCSGKIAPINSSNSNIYSHNLWHYISLFQNINLPSGRCACLQNQWMWSSYRTNNLQYADFFSRRIRLCVYHSTLFHYQTSNGNANRIHTYTVCANKSFYVLLYKQQMTCVESRFLHAHVCVFNIIFVVTDSDANISLI